MHNTFKIITSLALLLSFVTAASAQISSSVRTVQFRNIDFERQSIEIHNYGTEDQPLDGWRFCSHDEDQVRRYSNVAAFNGVVLPAGESIFLMYNNDACFLSLNEFNISDLGNFALPLDTNGAYAIQFYFQTPFGVGSNIADHVQFSLNGEDDGSADERSDEAIVGGVWTDENLWVPVADNTISISLDESVVMNDLHGPDDYVVDNRFVFMPGASVTAELFGGELFVSGTTGPDDIFVTQAGGQVEVSTGPGSVVENFNAQEITRVIVNGFSGADEIVADVALPTLLLGGSGADIIKGGSARNEIFGGPGADHITGGPADDNINSGQGQDFVSALGGIDFINGGDAADELLGGPGNDWINGGLGADRLVGGNGDDLLIGNAGADVLIGGAGSDILCGLGGPDELNGGAGDDFLTGGAGFDELNGAGGFDVSLDVGEVEISIERLLLIQF